MPLFNFDKEFARNLNHDVTIVGAGAVGIFLSINLAKKGKKVLLLESGNLELDESKQKLNEVEQTGKHLGNAIWGRKRAVGGTTISWGGQSLPFNDLDFKKKNWLKNSGWCISINELTEHYKIANRFMKIDDMNYSTDIFPKIKVDFSKLFFKDVDYHVSKWAKEPNFFKLYKDELVEFVDVLYNCQLLNINLNESEDSAKSIEISNFNFEKKNIRVNKLIIAAGGLETTRILLLNKKIALNKNLGKGFMDHPCLEIGVMKNFDPYNLQKYFNVHIWRGRRYSLRLSINEKIQKEKQLLNSSASLMFKYEKDDFNPYNHLLVLKNKFNLGSLFKFLYKASIAKVLKGFIQDKMVFKVNSRPTMVVMCEQEWTEKSNLSLCENQKDIFGLPKLNINWSISHLTWKTICEFADVLKAELKNNNFGDLEIHEHIFHENVNWENHLTDVNHHMGGTKMSETIELGVVDRDLKVWGIENLFVCSSSVFPTSSHSNPTLTTLALASRLVQSQFLS